MKLQLYPPECPSYLPGPGLPAFHEPSPMASHDTGLASAHSAILLLPALSHCSSRHAAKHTLSDQLLTSLSLPAVPSNAHSLAQRQERIAWQLPPELPGYTPPRQNIASTIHCPT